ncbi:hypothetical protein TEA_022820 [Camellia sinensis var. sinensis]|uniref:DUF676 domain-containing protein n=2 Tax=Camellia sinensis TaxID=4442 RepID=A0A4S4EKN4_CAMSN|nr:hypothetical protein TEA_022820 [Camellia sinensis var. sinensis]
MDDSKLWSPENSCTGQMELRRQVQRQGSLLQRQRVYRPSVVVGSASLMAGRHHQLKFKCFYAASSCNSYTKTFAGIDGAGKRLADEIMQIVKRTESLKRISFLAHSLGGVFARYAIAVLYSPAAFDGDQSNDLPASTNANLKTACSSRRGMIAKLEPVNFITLATPHLGVRGKKQLPFLLGVPILEKLAPSFAPIFAGRTGSQLFLTDGKPNNPPLLLRMASDCEDGKFISALGAFRCRILYANVSYDHLVGWRTSSIRRETQLFKPPRQSLDGYKHVVDVEYCPPISSEGPHFPPEAAKAKEAAQNAPNTENTNEYHEIMEGAGVVAHVADSIKQQEMQQKDSKLFIVASLVDSTFQFYAQPVHIKAQYPALAIFEVLALTKETSKRAVSTMTEKEGGIVKTGHEEGTKMAISLLEEFELPSGLLPLADVIEVGFVRSTGYMWIVQKKKVEHNFKMIGKLVSYDTGITGYVEKKRIKKLKGVKAKELMLWPPVSEIMVNEPPSGKIQFKSLAGITKTFPVEAFAADQ